jgi:hypothetical protein
MNSAIKGFMLAGIGGVITYAVIAAVLTAVVTGTAAADTFVKTVVPIVAGAGAVWLIVVNAFRD